MTDDLYLLQAYYYTGTIYNFNNADKLCCVYTNLSSTAVQNNLLYMAL